MIDPRTATFQYRIPHEPEIVVHRGQACQGPGGSQLDFDVYLPARSDRSPPVVLFVHGDGPPEFLAGAKDWPQFTGWGRLLAASGMGAVTFNRRSTENFARIAEAEAEVRAMVAHLDRAGDDFGFDAHRLGVWTCSAGPPTVVPWLVREAPPALRCVVVYYGLLDLQPVSSASESQPGVPEPLQPYSAALALGEVATARAVPPMLVVRAGRDRPAINENLDRFAALALARNAPVEIFNHPDAEHGFEVINAGARSDEAIGRTVEFLRTHLADR